MSWRVTTALTVFGARGNGYATPAGAVGRMKFWADRIPLAVRLAQVVKSMARSEFGDTLSLVDELKAVERIASGSCPQLMAKLDRKRDGAPVAG